MKRELGLVRFGFGETYQKRTARRNVPKTYRPVKTVCDYVHLNPGRAHLLRITAEEPGRLKWQMAELNRRPKTDPGKLAIAAGLRKETSPPTKDIAARVCLGTYKSADARLHVWLNQTPSGQTAHTGQTELGL